MAILRSHWHTGRGPERNGPFGGPLLIPFFFSCAAPSNHQSIKDILWAVQKAPRLEANVANQGFALVRSLFAW